MFFEQISFALNLCEFKAPYQESDPLCYALCWTGCCPCSQKNLLRGTQSSSMTTLVEHNIAKVIERNFLQVWSRQLLFGFDFLDQRNI